MPRLKIIRSLRNPLVAVVVFAASLGISAAYDSYNEKKGSMPKSSEVQRTLDQLARHHATEDELPKLLAEAKNVSLNGGRSLLAVSRLRVGADGNIVVLDAFGHTVQRFDARGRRLGPVGSGEAGSAPGEFLFPSGVDIRGMNITVSDFKQTRISRLSSKGIFEDSFSTAAERFSAKSVFRSHDGADIYVCGNRYSVGLTEIHRYSGAGVFEGSVLPMPDWARQLNLDAFNDCLPASSAHRTVVAFPYDYKVYETFGGELKALDIAVPADFRKPSRQLVFAGVDSSQHLSVFERWKAEWTPLETIALPNDTQLLVEYRTYAPLRYTLDIWNLASGGHVKTIHTNYRLLTADSSGRLYFLADHIKEGDPYGILSGSISQ